MRATWVLENTGVVGGIVGPAKGGSADERRFHRLSQSVSLAKSACGWMWPVVLLAGNS